MIFSSITFLIYFLPVFLIAYYFTPSKLKNLCILLFSIFFYAWGEPKFIFILLGTTFLDFHLVSLIYSSKKQKTKNILLAISLCLNLGLLFYFKYYNFFIENINHLLPNSSQLTLLKIALPLGISFYTFESLTYVLDVYKGVHKPLKSFLNYQTYILFFPKLLVGPIIRYHDIADQIIDREKNNTNEVRLSGFYIFCIGLAKKIIIANTLASQADKVFALPDNELDFMSSWVGALAFVFQNYFDFSGYSDMAIGLGKMTGFRLLENFNNPFLAKNISDFWRRWHISLTNWLNNYIFFPLVASFRNGETKGIVLAIIITFLISGLWHGAGWNFIVFGLLHGLALSYEVLTKKSRKKIQNKIPTPIYNVISILLTFLFIVITFVIFRLSSLKHSFVFIQNMFSSNVTYNKFTVNNDFIFFCCLAAFFAFFACTTFTKNLQLKIYGETFTVKQHLIMALMSVILLYVSMSFISAVGFSPFIYFKF